MNGKLSALLPAIAGILFCCSCAPTGNRPSALDLPPRYDLPAVAQHQARPAEGSIYNAHTTTDLYSDRRASRVGDIVLVKIVETSTGTKKASTKTERDSSISADTSALFGFEKWLSDKNPNFAPSSAVKLGMKNEFDGDGETKRASTVSATLSARVIDVTMHGNLVIRGFREVRVNNETQYIVLSGLVRPEDISPDNSVLSSYIADARIEYTGQGALSDKQQPGWLARGMDAVWPF